MPYWLLDLFLLRHSPLPPGSRWRFSLRTLLIATTLVAVVLGLRVGLFGRHQFPAIVDTR